MMRQVLLVVAVSSIFHLGDSAAPTFPCRDGSTPTGTLKEVEIQPAYCSSNECSTRRGNTVTLSVSLTVPPTRYARNWKISAKITLPPGGKLFGFIYSPVQTLSVNMDNEEFCRGLTRGSCSSRSRQYMAWSYSRFVPGFVPAGAYKLTIELVDRYTTILCQTGTLRLE